MGFHHVALATHDTAATHAFYTDVMGFSLVKVVVAPNPGDHGGWSKHFFYTTGESTDAGMIAFWEIHDPLIGEGYRADINDSVGLPVWVNHIAFDAPTFDDLHRHRDRWRSHGHHVLEVDHDFCTSVYIRDPSGNMVEFCHTTRPFTEEETAHALDVLHDPAPALETGKHPIVHAPLVAEAAASS